MKSLESLSRKICLTFLLVLIALMPVSGNARSATTGPTPIPPNTPLRFSSLSLEQGLSQSVVNVTYQDSEGYLWFGTQDGLNRYDGYHFTIFRPDPDDPFSLNDRQINTIIEDTHGCLWIGTMLGGVNRYDRLTGLFTQLVHDPHDPDSLGGNSIHALLVDQMGMLWIGNDGGLDVFDPQQSVFLAHYRNNPNDPTSLLHNRINNIYQDRSGVIWIATEKGLSYQDQVNGSFKHFTHNPNDPASLISNSVTHIFEDQEGYIWLGTEMGLERLDRQTQTFEHFTPNSSVPGSLSYSSVRAVLEDHNGNLWVGTADGLNLLDRQSERFTIYRHKTGDPNSLSNSAILSLYEDQEGILWIGTFGGGINKLDLGHNKFPILQYDPRDPKDISSFGLIEDHIGQLWFTMYGEGLLRLNRETGEYTIYRHDPNDPENSLLDNFVMTVSESRDGTIWIGSDQGLNALDLKTGQFTHYRLNEENPDSPNNLNGRVVGYTLEDSQGILWIAMPTGLDRFDRSTGLFTHYKYDPENPTSLSNPNVAYIFESQEGEIWLGMYESGLSKLDQKTGQFTHYRHNPDDPKSLSSDAVYMIMQDHTGAMWLGTNEGLNQFDPQSGTSTHYTVKDGLPNDVIYAIVEDDQGYLWLSTNFGLSRFDPRIGSFQNYDFNDGLQSNEFNPFAFAKTRADEIIFAGFAGVNIFRPGEILSNDYVPPIVLTQLTQGGESVKVEQNTDGTQKVTLHWPHNYFEFEFAALSYSNPEKNHYAYRLDKFDQDWIANGSYNVGRYTNLPGGTYTLHIKGSNNDGLWNESGIDIAVTVVPPIWQTWWFRGLTMILVAAGAFALYRLRVRSIESYNRDLKQQVEERTREIETLFEQTKELAIIEERNRLARDLHDSAKQKAFAALAQLGAARRMMTREPNTAKNHLNEVEDLVYEVIQELTFLIQEMYPMALKEKGLITVMREYLYEWENRNDIYVSLTVNQERRLPLEIEQALYRITQESLANVARHSHASQVSIELNYNGETVEMALSDNGCGFNLSQKPAGVGLRIMRERAVMIGGSIEIDSTPGTGTQIRVSAPTQQIEKITPNSSNGGHNDSPNYNPDRG
jgi:ligand-binding sensor domain-containing protein/signal transduction histidine kinase